MRLIFFCLKVILFILAFMKISEFCEYKTDKFRLSRIFSNLKFNPKWETAPLSLEKKAKIKQILSQKFTYLASGGQCFAFVSEDGNYILKFFKHHRRTLPAWFQALPLPQSLALKREEKLK